MSDEAKTCETCEEKSCASKQAKPGETAEAVQERQALARRMCAIKKKYLVMSGKGGVGKSTVSVNVAATLAQQGYRVGLLDVDIHGPSIPTMLNLYGKRPVNGEDGILPLEVGSLKVMSLGLLLEGRDQAVIWRGPMKMNVIKQFLTDVEWGELDYLIVDAPPGTGDEPLSVCQLIEGLDGALIVTTPQEVAISDVRRSVNFCRQVGVPVLGIVENMSGFVCPHCGKETDVFRRGGGEKLASEMNVSFLGRIPMDPRVVLAGDEGQSFVEGYPDSPATKAFAEVVVAVRDGGK
ncbi:MAG: Mrp/NBP35 family ATP-binding protein [Kiritimatiellae bacterium]|nr:Mrp/NBP35 family ATP-binding protein [Kiritimatiellia bacterium]MDD4734779.1 Mrp/NBP35 family ATP-binding protein [Kiritimatiellia bacterium]